MNIVFILPGTGVSGGIRVTVAAANHLIRRGHEVRIIHYRSAFDLKTIYNQYITNYLLGTHFWLDDFRGPINKFSDIRKCEFKEDEIIIAVGMWASSQLEAINYLKNPKLQYLHGTTPWDVDLMKSTLSMSIPKIVVATYLKTITESCGGKVLAVIPNGIDLNEYYSSTSDNDKNGVGTIYSSHQSKDPNTIKIVVDLLRMKNNHITLRAFGSEKKPRNMQLDIYKRNPSIKDARDIYSKSQVWFVASRSEGFSLPVLEAMACGAIVVSTDCGGTRDIIINGENGLLVEVGAANQIVDNVLMLLHNRNMRDEIREKGRKTVKRYSWDSSVDLIENILNSM